MSFAFVFPGQGSQSIGMLAAFAGESSIRATFDEASHVLGYDLWAIVQDGPDERLNSTDCTQPAMLAAGVAIWRLWLERGGSKPVVVAGHSLGEFSALVCAGSLQFGATVALVQLRGQLMQQAVPAGTGAMAAVLGLSDETVSAACAEAAQGEVVEAVNFNSPSQVVIAGAASAVARAMESCRDRGAKRVVILPVSVPSHSALMRPAAVKFSDALRSTTIAAPLIEYVSAVDAKPYSDGEAIRDLLGRQLASPVRWTDTIRTIGARGVAQIIECGPGKVLTGLNRRIEKRPDLQFLALDDLSSLDVALGNIAC